MATQKSIGLSDTNWRICSRKRARGGGAFHRTAPNGDAHAPIWELAMRIAVINCRFRSGASDAVSFIRAPIVAASFRELVVCGISTPALPAAALSIVGVTIRASNCG